jgi:hypothetical protein
LQFEVIKVIKQLKASFRLFRRDLSGDLRWRFITKVENVDVCAVLDGAKMIPLINHAYELYKKLLPHFPQKCPIMSGKYSAVNISTISYKEDDMTKSVVENQDASLGIFKNMLKSMTPVFPNGYYKHLVQFSRKSDPNGATLSWIAMVDFRMNEDRFKK